MMFGQLHCSGYLDRCHLCTERQTEKGLIYSQPLHISFYFGFKSPLPAKAILKQKQTESY